MANEYTWTRIYINPYSATGTCNTVYINGLYLDVRKGKEPKSSNDKIIKKKVEYPDINSYVQQLKIDNQLNKNYKSLKV